MIIYDNKGVAKELNVTDESCSYEAIHEIYTLTLYFSSCDFIEIPVGSYCDFNGRRYTLEMSENFTKQGERNFEYTLTLDSPGAKLRLWKVSNPVDGRIKFSYTAKPREHIQLIVDCLNRYDTGWVVGSCLDSEERTVNYNHTYLIDGLISSADTFKTEWEIDNKTINLRKVEYNKDNPLALSYGKGLKKGIEREVGEMPPEVILIEGTERNIDFSKYGSKTLLLPKSQTLEYNERLYKTSADGTRVMRADKELTNGKQDSLDCSEIYPSRVGEVSSVITIDAKKNLFDFVDASIPESLDFNKYLIAGETMTVIFQTGMLSTREFDVKYIHDAKTENGVTKPGRRFEIVPQELDGIMMPDNTSGYVPVVRDKYAVFGIQLPDEYICNNQTKEGASWDMFREVVRFLYENEDQKFTYKCALNGIWAKKRWLQIGGKIKLGGYVQFSDEQFQQNGVLIRMTGIKTYVNKPHKPEIELSNCAIGTSISNEFEKIPGNEVVVEDKFNEALQFTKRRFRDSKETLEMLASALLNFSGSINPVTVHTMMMLLGDESLQYRFVNSKTNPSQVGHVITYDNEKKILHVPAGIIQHMTLGIKSVSSTHKVSEYKFWDIPQFNSPILVDKDAYYLYVKVSKTTQNGEFWLSKTAIKIEQISGYYHLLVGVLNSEFDAERSFVELYGFTEILPGRITTDRVVSSDGLNFIDFVNNAFRVGNNSTYLDFNTKGDGKLRLKGIIVQSDSGVEFPIGVFRGAFSYSYTYYKGDEVTYNDGTGISTYKYINDTPRSGIYPTNTSYWQVVAKGQQGLPGDNGIDGGYFEYRYAKNGSTTSFPSLSYNSANPSGWTTSVPSVYALEYLWFTVAQKDCNGNLVTIWSTPKRMTPYDGIDGAKGDIGPAMAYQGVYNPSKTYFGTGKRVDAVKYNNIYYVARVDAGNGFVGKLPTDTKFWNEFGNQFENVATNLLLAESASIGSWWHKGGKIVSTLDSGNKITLDASAAKIIIESTYSGGQSSLDRNIGSVITLDATNGIVEARGRSNTSRVAYMSPSGIFCNSANTQAVSACFGSDVRGAIVGLGYGTVNKSDWDNGNFLTGVYGTASNSGNAPAYGGFFQNLMAAGLLLNRKAVESSGVYISSYDALVIGYSNGECTVYLPNDGIIGRIIIFKQWGTGSMKVYTRGGQVIYDDNTVNPYFRVSVGRLVIAIFTIGYINGVKKEAWLINTVSELIND